MSIDDRGGLMERPDEVLALGQVHPGLAADRRIDLGDERRRDLDEPDAAQVDRGQEPGRVAERAAADRDQRSPRSTRIAASSRAAVSMTSSRLAASPCGSRMCATSWPRSRRPAASRSPTAAQAPGSLTRIARGARSASSSEPTAPAAIPSPSTIRPIGVDARSRVVGRRARRSSRDSRPAAPRRAGRPHRPRHGPRSPRSGGSSAAA